MIDRVIIIIVVVGLITIIVVVVIIVIIICVVIVVLNSDIILRIINVKSIKSNKFRLLIGMTLVNAFRIYTT